MQNKFLKIREKYLRFNIITLFVFIDDNIRHRIYFKFGPAFALNCYKSFILHKFLQRSNYSFTSCLII